MRNKIVSFILMISVLLVCSGCGSEQKSATVMFDNDAESIVTDDTLISENSNYRLELDSETMGIILTEKATGIKWGTTPSSDGEAQYDEFGMPIKKHPQLSSVLLVTYQDYETNTENDVISYTGSVKNGRTRCIKEGDSLRVEFYFDEAEFMIPIVYTLKENSVQITIDSKNIQENKNKIHKISLAPFWCSVENDRKDTYLFVPSGSGALVDTSARSQQGEAYSTQVYGQDISIDETAKTSERMGARLPVFGAKSSADIGMFAIITEGAESALIDVKAGSTAIGYSSVFASFWVRGYTNHVATLFSSTKVNNKVFSKALIETPLSVEFYPLKGENADYNGMADICREYYTKGLEKTSAEKPYNITFIGGAMISNSFLGIPYNSLYVATTLNEAANIIADINMKTGESATVCLKGFGNKGLDIGEIAGGYKIGNKFGSVSDLNKLHETCTDNSSELYFDFDITRFSESGKGFSCFYDSAYDSGGQRALNYVYNVATKDKDKSTLYYLLRPSKFTASVEKLNKKLSKWNIDGISLATLSSLCYSDYRDNSDTAYYSRSKFQDAARSVFEAVKKSGKKLMSYDANAYAAVLSDIILNAPLVSDGERLFIADIPFYEMVFKGYIPMTTESVNLAGDSDKLILRAVESGCALNYTVMKQWDNPLLSTAHPEFYNGVYDDVVNVIVKNNERLSEYYSKTANAQITSHRILESGARETVFDNGVKVYVNYSNDPVGSPAGEVAALDYLIMESPQ